MFDCTKIARLLFGWQSYTFIENYMNSLSQGVFDCTKIAGLLLGWQSYTIIEILP